MILQTVMQRLILFIAFPAGRGGDVINFYADVKSIENNEAIRLLAKN